MAAGLQRWHLVMGRVADPAVFFQGGLQMRRLFLLASSFALCVTLALPATAQTTATFVLRSGERISGDLVDMAAAGFTVRVGGAPRQLRTGDVVVIDFRGSTSFPDSEVKQITAGKHLIVLSSGQTVSGTLYDIGGTQPKRISVHTDSGNRDFQSNEIRRIYLDRPSGARSATATTAQPPIPATLPATGGQIHVPGTQRWTDTGITVRRGEGVTFNASGQVQLSANASDTAGPAGSNTGRYPSGPMPRVLAGALIGRVGPVAMFGIGNSTGSMPMPADGRLYLGVNDDVVNDNRGEFTVDVRPNPSSGNRR
jgi:hypothetical protein